MDETRESTAVLTNHSLPRTAIHRNIRAVFRGWRHHDACLSAHSFAFSTRTRIPHVRRRHGALEVRDIEQASTLISDVASFRGSQYVATGDGRPETSAPP